MGTRTSRARWPRMLIVTFMTISALMIAVSPVTAAPPGSEGREQMGQNCGPGGRRGGPDQGPPPPGPVMQALDTDKDGVLSQDEIANAVASLLTLDKNSDGELSRDELRPPRPESSGNGDTHPPRSGQLRRDSKSAEE